MKSLFPPDFLWGTATASYQIEGAVHEDGRGLSIWDTFSHTPGKIANGDTGDVACDHYHRFETDIHIMKEIGLNAYRASITWSRILPDGKGQLNRKGIDFYNRLTDTLLDAGIQPMYTLFHWDLPEGLQKLGGWANRDLTEYFRDYCAIIFQHLGDRVHYWITLNEPSVHTYLGHLYGTHAPGLTDWKTATQTAHHLLVAHGLAVQAFREGGFPGSIGITLNINHFEAAGDTAEHRQAAQRMDGLWNRWYLDPLFKQSYPADIWELYENHRFTPSMKAGDLALISQPLDFLGINYYYREIIHADPTIPVLQASASSPPPPITAMGWEIFPDGLYHVLTRIKREYTSIPIYITENGAAFPDVLQNGTVQDTPRIDYLKKHFQAAAEALAAGVDLRGYFIWSLLDNFEWACGYEKRFGIIYIDYATQQRYWKQSAYWLKDFLAVLR
ncbi:MAG TPA: GH1 family beta-glucosidase [Bacillota bacterium]|nr:GH1 family beta-glucosidase [Bacillota bacterium]HPT86801.1 GH1 family beta-glucosidase [Bacillota bacterium]